MLEQPDMTNIRVAGVVRRVVRFLFSWLKAIHVISTPTTVADILEAAAPRIVQPDRMDAFDSGLAKLREEPWEKPAAWLTGPATWICRSEDEFELIQKPR
jgi:hypothetical protein